MKINKNIWVFIIIGVVVLAGVSLGTALNQQAEQKEKLAEQLAKSQKNLALFNNEKLIVQKEQLNTQVNEYAAQARDIKFKLTYSDDNINITDSLVQTAADCEVDILSISSSGKAAENLAAVQYQIMNMTIKARGTTDTIATFVYTLKKTFPTGVIKSLTLDVIEPEIAPVPLPDDETVTGDDGETVTGDDEETVTDDEDIVTNKDTTITINMIIYSHMGG